MTGTLPFMAPELFSGEAPSIASDIYAVGVTLYFLAMGALPFWAPNSKDLARAITNENIPLEDLAPPELAAVVAKAMARAPDLRYATAEELGQDIERIVVENTGVTPRTLQQFEPTRKLEVPPARVDIQPGRPD